MTAGRLTHSPSVALECAWVRVDSDAAMDSPSMWRTPVTPLGKMPIALVWARAGNTKMPCMESKLRDWLTVIKTMSVCRYLTEPWRRVQ